MSLRVVHTFGRNAGAVQTLGKAVVRFGRAADNDVVFDPDYDRDASAYHAEIRNAGGQSVLVDLGSRNGTFVGGERVRHERPLASGDEIMFGPRGPRVRVEIRGAADGNATHAPDPTEIPVATSREPGAAVVPTRPPGEHSPSPVAASPNGTVAMSHGAGLGPGHAAVAGSGRGVAAAPAGAPRAVVAQVAAPVPAPPAGSRRVGQRTIAFLISSAVAAAGRGRGGQNTQEINAYVDRELRAATADQKRTLRGLATLLLVALASLVGLIVWSSQANDDIDKLRGELAKLPPGDPRRKDIEGRLGTLHPSNASFGRNLYDRSRKGIFMLAVNGQGFCTAFAVRPNVLATNAHCVYAAKRAHGLVVALENEGHGQVSYPITDTRAHPAYRDGDVTALTPDVGIVTISGRSAIVLAVASQAELSAMGAGDDVYLIGFPGRLMDASNPGATFLAAHIGRITNAGGRPAPYNDDWILQHDAVTTAGTSGSPIFNGRGKVIAINAGSYTESDDETIGGRKASVVKESPYKFGMRIDLLNAVLR